MKLQIGTSQLMLVFLISACLCALSISNESSSAASVVISAGCHSPEGSVHKFIQDVSIMGTNSATVRCSHEQNNTDVQTDEDPRFPPPNIQWVRLDRLCISQCFNLPQVALSRFSGHSHLRSVIMENSSIKLLLDDFSNQLDNLKYLGIFKSNLKAIPGEIFCKIHSLQRLNASGNHLVDVISPSAFSPEKCASVVHDMDLSDNYIEHIARFSFVQHKALRRLSLRSNLILEIESSAFESLKRLWLLDLSNNSLMNLPNRIFRENVNLRVLLLQGNKLKHIAANVFSPHSHIFQINLSNNNLKTIKPFLGLQNLRQFHLSGNDFRTFPRELLTLVHLHDLDLSNNKIERMMVENSSVNSDLSIMNLSKNRITELNIEALTLFGKLKRLDLSENLLYISNQKSNDRYPESLQDLCLRFNNWRMIPESISRMKSLRKLDLSYNAISSVHFSSLEETYRLEYLDLAGNELESLHPLSLKNSVRLNRINLSSNRLQYIPERLFHGNLQLRYIDLSSNELGNISHIFSKLDNLLLLNLSSNVLKSLDFVSIPNSLRELDISNNQLTNMTDVYNKLRISQIRLLDVSYNMIVELNKMMVPDSAETLIFKANRIENLKQSVFANMKQLKFVDLSQNRLSFLSETFLRFSAENVHFNISANPLICDCQFEWLISGDKFILSDQHNIACRTTQGVDVNPFTLSTRMSFLCSYTRHCFTLCQCCEFDACDCEQICPEGCTCWHDNLWKTNIVVCSLAGYSIPPESIPMDASEIRLDGNRLKQIDHLMFLGRRNLHNLYLNNSGILLVANNTFNALSNLKKLYLQNNELVDIDGRFGALHSLEYLYLDNNNLTHISLSAFSGLTSLIHLGLSGNRLVELNLWEIKLLSLSSVTLANNPWRCLCNHRSALKSWFQKQLNAGFHIDQVTCASGESFISLNSCEKVVPTSGLPDSMIFLLAAVSCVLTVSTFITAVMWRSQSRRRHKENTDNNNVSWFPENTTQHAVQEDCNIAFISCDPGDQLVADRVEYILGAYCSVIVLHRDVRASVEQVECVVDACSLVLLLNSPAYVSSVWSCPGMRSAHVTCARARGTPLIVVDLQLMSEVVTSPYSSNVETNCCAALIPSVPRISFHDPFFEWKLQQFLESSFDKIDAMTMSVIEPCSSIYTEIIDDGFCSSHEKAALECSPHSTSKRIIEK